MIVIMFFFQRLLCIVKSVIEKITEIELPDIPRNIASVEKPDKKDIVKNQKSRFAI